MRHTHSLLLLGVGVAAAAPTHAQLAEAERAPPHVRTYNEGDAKSTAASFGNDFVIEAGDADAKATLSVSDFFTAGGRTHRYRVQASAPFDRKKADSVDVGTLSGLTAGTSVGAEYSFVDWPKANEDRKAAVEKLCREIVPTVIEGYGIEVVDPNGDWDCNAEHLTIGKFQHAIETLKQLRAKCSAPGAAVPAAVCAQLEPLPEPRLSAVALEALRGAPDRLSALIDEVTTPVSLWTVSTGVNQQKFSYVLPTAPETTIGDEERGWNVAAAYTRLSDALLWSLGYSHERTYKAGDKAQICTPLTGTTSLSCKEATLGAPKRSDSELAFAEIRWIAIPGKLAISPRVQFDFEESEWAVRVPVYLVRNKAGAFTAGIAVGYTSKDDEAGASVFVGKEFSFLE
jgi:hypothetical protein